MDLGPQNVLGKRTSLVDPIVMEFVNRMERYMNDPEMEFEARLGILTLPTSSKSATRLPLPIITETMLAPSGSCVAQNGRGFKYEFQAGLVDESVFKKVAGLMDILHSQKFDHNPPNPVFKVLNVSTSKTVDEVFRKPLQCRVRYDWSTYPPQFDTEPLEFIAKETLEKMDVWMGHCVDIDDEGTAEEEGQMRHPLDYRLAINREKKLDRSLLSSLNRADCTMRRDRVRVSYEMKAWVVDLTTVVEAGTGITKYEVEAELKLDLLREQFARRAAQKSNGVYQIVQDFLQFMRDLACMFGPDSSERISDKSTIYPDLSVCGPDESLKRKYAKIISPDVFPIIGDYVFKIIDEVAPPS